MPAHRRALAHHMVNAHRYSKRCAVYLVGRSGSYSCYKRISRDDPEERARIREIAEASARFGMLRNRALMLREGWLINRG